MKILCETFSLLFHYLTYLTFHCLFFFQFQIEEALLRKKKEELLQMYTSTDILKEEAETKALIGKQ